MSNSLDPDQARHFVGSDLGPNCLQKLSADDTSSLKDNCYYHRLHLALPQLNPSKCQHFFQLPNRSDKGMQSYKKWMAKKGKGRLISASFNSCMADLDLNFFPREILSYGLTEAVLTVRFP